MVSYDPEVLYEFANRLYRRANQIIAVAVVIGLLVGGVAGYAAEATVGTITIVGVVLGGAIGYVWGTQRAFIPSSRHRRLCVR